MKIIYRQIHPCVEAVIESHVTQYPEFSFDTAKLLLQRLFDERLIQNAINYELAQVNENNLFESLYWTPRGFLLAAGRAYGVTVDRVPKKRAQSLSSIAQNAVVAALNDGVHFDRFALPSDLRLDVLDRSVKLNLSECAPMPAFQPVTVDCSTDVYDFFAPSETTSWVVKILAPVTKTFTWAFDRKTLHAWNIAGSSVLDDQVLTALDALAHMGSEQHVATVERYLEADAHHIRWKALQTLNELAPERARAAIGRFLEDPHPHLRAAAQNALGME